MLKEKNNISMIKKTDLKNGLQTEWYDNGQKRIEGYYNDGKKEGLHTEWETNGWKEIERNYKNGKLHGLCIRYEFGVITSKIEYKNGVRHGTFIGFYKNGSISNIEFFKNGKLNGLVIDYQKSPNWDLNRLPLKKSEQIWKNGYPNGESIYYYNNGKKSEECYYKGFKNFEGLRTRWYWNGQKKSEENYIDGELISSKKWNEDGSIKE